MFISPRGNPIDETNVEYAIDQLGIADSPQTFNLPTNQILVTIDNQSLGATVRYCENTSGQTAPFAFNTGTFYVTFTRLNTQSLDTRCLCLVTTSTPPLFLDDSNRNDGTSAFLLFSRTAINVVELYATLLEKVI